LPDISKLTSSQLYTGQKLYVFPAKDKVNSNKKKVNLNIIKEQGKPQPFYPGGLLKISDQRGPVHV
jgi:hypothetical protein